MRLRAAGPEEAAAGFVERCAEGGQGLRIAVKDMIGVAGARQTAGLPFRRERRPAHDADAVAMLRTADFRIAGTTVSDAAGFGTMTNALANPVAPGRAVGGSSGGAAAAIAAGWADVGLGTDTGGSVRIPAAYCGLFALKPTRGRIPTAGVLPLSPTFDTVGLLAADLGALTQTAEVLLDGWRHAEPLPLALDTDALAVATAAQQRAVRAALGGLAAADRTTSSPPFNRMATAHAEIVCREALAVHHDDWRREPYAFPQLVAEALTHGEMVAPRDIARARKTLADDAALMADRAARVALVGPTLAIEPAPRHARTARLGGRVVSITHANIRLTLGASVAGLPAVVLPLGGTSIQLVGAAGRDEALLATARAIYEALSR